VKRLLVTVAAVLLALAPRSALADSAPPHTTGNAMVDLIVACVDFHRPLLEIRATATQPVVVRALDPAVTVETQNGRDFDVAYNRMMLAMVRADANGNPVVHGATVFSEGDPAKGGIGRIYAVRDNARCATGLPRHTVTFGRAAPASGTVPAPQFDQTTSFSISVTGAVSRPGSVELHDGDRLSLALARAGVDASIPADLERVYVLQFDITGRLTGRVLNLLQAFQRGDRDSDPVLHAGQMVFVPQKDSIAAPWLPFG
jgi:hypothetical protein